MNKLLSGRVVPWLLGGGLFLILEIEGLSLKCVSIIL